MDKIVIKRQMHSANVVPTMNLNGRVYEYFPEFLDQAQRAFFYGDALFETIRVFDGRLPWLSRHWARLSAGLQALGYELPDLWSAAFFEAEIRKIAPPNARVRLTVWRNPGGLYAPEDNHAQFLITASSLGSNRFEWIDPGILLGVCTSVRLPVDDYSNFKTLNAPRYVAAARMAQNNGWDDALLLNAHERICEATSSNVFWWEGPQMCTAPLSEGCVAGIARSVLLESAPASGFAVQEKPATFAALRQADEIFLTNAIRGIVPVRDFAGQSLADLKTKGLFMRVYEV